MCPALLKKQVFYFAESFAYMYTCICFVCVCDCGHLPESFCGEVCRR